MYTEKQKSSWKIPDTDLFSAPEPAPFFKIMFAVLPDFLYNINRPTTAALQVVRWVGSTIILYSPPTMPIIAGELGILMLNSMTGGGGGGGGTPILDVPRM